MKNDTDPKSSTRTQQMRDEYRFEYSKAKPNRFASRSADAPVVVALEPDVGEVFRTSEQAGTVLRALIQTMPARPERKRAAGRQGKDTFEE